MKYLLLLLLLFYYFTASANRCFEAYDAPVGGNKITVFCVGQKVYFRDCAGIDADKEYYDYDHRNGTEFTSPEAREKAYTFTQPGTYTVTQFGNLNGVNDTFARTFEVKGTAAPVFTASACAGRMVTVTITDKTYDTYSLNLGDGTTPVDVTPEQPYRYTYAADGTYTLTLTGAHNNASCATSPATQTVTTQPALPTPQLKEIKVLAKERINGSISFIIEQIEPHFTYFLDEVNESNSIVSSEQIISLEQTGTLSLTKEDLNTTIARCYRIRATDACGNEAVSPSVCTVALTASARKDENILLSWVTETGVQGSGVIFSAEVLDQNNTVIDSFTPTGNPYMHNPEAFEAPVLRYRIKATSGNGIYVSYSNTEEIPQPARIYVPTGFTPNGDGLNDVFLVKGKFFQHFHIRIYNNLGQVVFESADAATGWDGTFKGKALPLGAFAYEIRVKAPDGSTRLRKGTVTLIR